MKAKPFWTSKTLWINVIALIAALGGIFEIDIGLTPVVQTAMVTSIMAVVNMILRAITKSAVTVKAGV